MLKRYHLWCSGRLFLTDWLPEEGLDPNLRELRCDKCGHEEFQLLTEDEIKRITKEAVKRCQEPSN